MINPLLTEEVEHISGALADVAWFYSADGNSAVGIVDANGPQSELFGITVIDGVAHTESAPLGEFSTGYEV